MRKAMTAAIGAATLAISSPALATPVITTFQVRTSPIPGIPSTGQLGEGALIKGNAKVAGTEYDGSPAPLIGVTILVPAGIKLDSQGFTSCQETVLREYGPEHCPKHSAAGPAGWALGTVSFGGERVPERATIQPFFAPGGGMYIFVDGRTPALVEIIAKGHVAGATAPFGHEFDAEVPLIETVPEAPDASFLEGAVGVGAGYRVGSRTLSYVTLPKHCPRGGWTVKGQARFLDGGEANATTKMPCPSP